MKSRAISTARSSRSASATGRSSSTTSRCSALSERAGGKADEQGRNQEDSAAPRADAARGRGGAGRRQVARQVPHPRRRIFSAGPFSGQPDRAGRHPVRNARAERLRAPAGRRGRGHDPGVHEPRQGALPRHGQARRHARDRVRACAPARRVSTLRRARARVNGKVCVTAEFSFALVKA